MQPFTAVRSPRYKLRFFVRVSYPLVIAMFNPVAAQAQAPGGGAFGTVFVAGPYVTVNGRPAQNGAPIRNGDTVATGPGSSALVSLARGGSVQLNQNTDPSFFEQARDALGCLVRTVLNTGEMYSDGQGVCGGAAGVLFAAQSQFDLQIVPGGAVLTITEGHVVLSGPEPASVMAGTQVSVLGGRIAEQHRISAAEQASIIGWRNQYRFGPVSGGVPTYYPPPQYSPSPTYYAPQRYYVPERTYQPERYYQQPRYNPAPRYSPTPGYNQTPRYNPPPTYNRVPPSSQSPNYNRAPTYNRTPRPYYQRYRTKPSPPDQGPR
jgi:hypothetical protein